MPRPRPIKPESSQNRKVGRLSDAGYRLWVNLIEQSDDEGRRIWDTDEFKVIIYAYHPKTKKEKILLAAQELINSKLVYFYVVNGCVYYQMHDWHDHHRIDHPTDSRIPPSDDKATFIMDIREHSRVIENTLPNLSIQDGLIDGSLIPVSLVRSNESKALLDYWSDMYLAKMGQRPRVEGKRDTECCKAILSGRTLDEAKAIVSFHFDHPDTFYEEKALYGIHHIRGAMNQIIARISKSTNMLSKKTAGNIAALEAFVNRDERKPMSDKTVKENLAKLKDLVKTVTDAETAKTIDATSKKKRRHVQG